MGQCGRPNGNLAVWDFMISTNPGPSDLQWLNFFLASRSRARAPKSKENLEMKCATLAGLEAGHGSLGGGADFQIIAGCGSISIAVSANYLIHWFPVLCSPTELLL